MAVIKVINSRKGSKQTKYDLHRIIQYIKKQEAEGGLVSGINCGSSSAYQEMLLNKRIFSKEKGRMYIHMEQSFPKDLSLTQEQIHELGFRLIQEINLFDNFQVVMATHTDKDHIHNHFCINSVGLDGKKWQLPPDKLRMIKEKSLALCEEYNIPIWWKDKENQKNKDSKQGNDSHLHTAKQGEYEKQKQGKSWKYELFLAIKECTKHAHSQEEFISNMNMIGFSVSWNDQHKYITFTTPEGKKCRNNRLYPIENFTKEYLLGQFERNAQRRSTQTVRDHQRQMDRFANLAKTIVVEQRAFHFTGSAGEFFPLTHIKSKLEGQALIDKAIEKSNSSFDWENEF